MNEERLHERLGLDHETLSNVAFAYAGRALATMREFADERAESDSSDEASWQLVAGNFAIAANAFATIDAAAAAICFSATARSFALAGSPLAGFFEVCSGGIRLKRIPTVDPTRNIASADELASTLVYYAFVSAKTGSYERSTLFIPPGDATLQGVGLTRAPLSAFQDLWEWTVGRKDHEVLLQRAMMQILSSYAAAINTARMDKFHWSQMLSELMPLPPEILASSMVYVASVHIARPQISLERMLAHERDWDIPLTVARNIASVPYDQDFRNGALQQVAEWLR